MAMKEKKLESVESGNAGLDKTSARTDRHATTPMSASRLTERQKETLLDLAQDRVRSSNGEGSVLTALERKGLVMRLFNSAPGYTYYTWRLSELGKTEVESLEEK